MTHAPIPEPPGFLATLAALFGYRRFSGLASRQAADPLTVGFIVRRAQRHFGYKPGHAEGAAASGDVWRGRAWKKKHVPESARRAKLDGSMIEFRWAEA